MKRLKWIAATAALMVTCLVAVGLSAPQFPMSGGSGVTASSTTTLANKTLTSPIINGTITTTGLTLPAFSESFAVGSSTTPGVTLATSTAAANAAQKRSPALTLFGNGWTGAASQQTGWHLDVLPVQGSPITSQLTARYQANGGTITDAVTIDHAYLAQAGWIVVSVAGNTFGGFLDGSGNGMKMVGGVTSLRAANASDQLALDGTTVTASVKTVAPEFMMNAAGADGTCGVAQRGTIRVLQGGGGVTDTLKACLKAAGGTYSWVSVTTGG